MLTLGPQRPHKKLLILQLCLRCSPYVPQMQLYSFRAHSQDVKKVQSMILLVTITANKPVLISETR